MLRLIAAITGLSVRAVARAMLLRPRAMLLPRAHAAAVARAAVMALW